MAHILLVDDDQDIIEMNRTALSQRGHRITAAFSAAEAKKAAEADAPELAVLDVMMEEKTVGFELARQLHALYPAMKLVMLTGISKEMDLRFSFGPDETWLPVSKFLEKPINPRILADEVDGLLKETA